jgi:Fur family ferric uptake transcriptional regulator
MRDGGYNTKRREAVLDCVASRRGEHLTAAQIADSLKEKGVGIGRTTVYRQLEKLTNGGQIRRFATDGGAACYQYAGHENDCHNHYHLKCEECDELLHIECDALDELERHITDSHSFKLNAAKTVLYGKCEHCRQGGANHAPSA